MTFNLLTEKWLSLKRKDGTIDLASPADIVCIDNPYIMMASPRSDFDGALLQMLIGLYQTAMMPKTPNDWRQRFLQPPSIDEVKEAFVNLMPAFELFESPQPFMQDTRIDDERKSIGIDELILDAPTGNTLKGNKDLFVKRGGIGGMCPACTASTLYTLQCFAPRGGRGHRTSIRGGGFMTTLVKGNDLWRTVWLNVLDAKRFQSIHAHSSQEESPFPWVNGIRTSVNDEEVAPVGINPLYVFWSTPMRVMLDHDSMRQGVCDICGRRSILFTQYRRAVHGENYGQGWRHPLTPYRTSKEGGMYPLRMEKSSIAYRYWGDLTLGSASRTTERAKAVSRAYSEARFLRDQDMERMTLTVFGFTFNGAIPISWIKADVPLFLKVEGKGPVFISSVEGLISLAEHAMKSLKLALTKAGIKLDDATAMMFWADTEEEFYSSIRQILDVDNDDRKVISGILSTWMTILRRVVLDIYDRKIQLDKMGLGFQAKQLVGRRDLLNKLSNKNKQVAEVIE